MRTIILAAALVGMVGCGKLPEVKQPSSQPPAEQKQQQRLTHEEFDAKINGLTTPKEIFAAVGQPFETSQAGEFFNVKWKGLTKDAITGKDDYSVTMVFIGTGMDSIYRRHQFHP